MLTHGAWPFAVLSFHHPDSVAQIVGKLELLAFDCPTQSFLPLTENRCALVERRLRRLVCVSRVTRVAVHAAQELAHARLECRIAAGATPAARRPEIVHRGASERAATAL